MKRRSEAQSAIHHAETGVNPLQDKKKPEQTLIGAIEQIVNLAIELQLGEAFYEKARESLTVVAERMSINEAQALIFALFMEKSAYSRIQISDFADLHLTDQQTKKKRDLIDCTTFAARELFYNPSVQRQIDRLGELLAPEHFAEIQQRLSAGGMRKEFACLFYGAPGTGKTETVYQLARRTGRDLMVVDVSQIKSCWVGESEKNIKVAFNRYRSYVRQSERAPILFFNEADAVLGIRQEGRSGPSRRWKTQSRILFCRRWSSWTAS